jgi:hypothetical protein
LQQFCALYLTGAIGPCGGRDHWHAGLDELCFCDGVAVLCGLHELVLGRLGQDRTLRERLDVASGSGATDRLGMPQAAREVAVKLLAAVDFRV